MKILVIGHSVFDFIDDGKSVTQSSGGIFYTISALNKIKSVDDEIFLCSQFDEESYRYFEGEFRKINCTYLMKTGRIPRVHLNLFKEKERHEKYDNISNNLLFIIEDYKFDGILINMITGFDINVLQLQEIRNNFAGLIYLDVHTLSRGLDENYKRNFRRIPEFRSWAKCLDIIQVNEQELFTLSGFTSADEIVEEILSYGVKIICVTKGDKGAEVYFKQDNQLIRFFVKAQKIINPNVVGCGDTFGAAFFYNYIRNNNVYDSIRAAVDTAGSFVKNKLN